ncbi:uncharacterized protein G2W53_009516 [Senna tora]|uniref:Uncharacterized protein n=1 Tax=Senna tora TaxID=362788 RepID=A0A834WYQ2_9FABA|nr:uncharacterized protein G2W53_009516 [Senna tora]
MGTTRLIRGAAYEVSSAYNFEMALIPTSIVPTTTHYSSHS